MQITFYQYNISVELLYSPEDSIQCLVNIHVSSISWVPVNEVQVNSCDVYVWGAAQVDSNLNFVVFGLRLAILLRACDACFFFRYFAMTYWLPRPFPNVHAQSTTYWIEV